MRTSFTISLIVRKGCVAGTRASRSTYENSDPDVLSDPRMLASIALEAQTESYSSARVSTLASRREFQQPASGGHERVCGRGAARDSPCERAAPAGPSVLRHSISWADKGQRKIQLDLMRRWRYEGMRIRVGDLQYQEETYEDLEQTSGSRARGRTRGDELPPGRNRHHLIADADRLAHWRA